MYESARICLESLRRCNSDPSFIDVFYKYFMASSAEVADKFANTDFTRQNEMLRRSLHMLILARGGHDEGDTYLLEIAKRHGRNDLKIRPELYDLWLTSLMTAVQKTDPQFAPEIEQAWRETLHQGIQYMLEHA